MNNYDEDICFKAFAGMVAGCVMYLLVGVLSLILFILFGF
jgi:hypothetical protein